VLGKPTDKMNKVFDIVQQAQTATLEGAQPACRSTRSTRAARKVIVDAGYGPGFKYLQHRVGHGMGMDGHEWPYLVKNNMFGWEKALTLQPHMTFSDEPGVYIRGEFGVRLEGRPAHHRERRGALHSAIRLARTSVRLGNLAGSCLAELLPGERAKGYSPETYALV
jgi:methionine aminopeptidase